MYFDIGFQMSRYTVGGLFSGIGGLELAFENAGFKISWSNELDDDACKTYELNHPKHNLIKGDIWTLLKEDTFPSSSVDVLIGGFPCQSFSVAGYRKGLDDERGNLFYSIINVIKKMKIKPKALVLENVKNLRTHDKGETSRIINKELEDLGYSRIWDIYNTSDYTDIPQNRERTVIVCFKDEKDHGLFKNEICSGYFDLNKELMKSKKKKPITDFLEKEVDEKYYYSPKTSFYKELQESVTDGRSVYQWRRKYIRKNKSNECPTLTANMGTGGHNVPIIIDKKGFRKLTQDECFRFKGNINIAFPDKMSDSSLYKQAGNSVTVEMFKKIAILVKNSLNTKY